MNNRDLVEVTSEKNVEFNIKQFSLFGVLSIIIVLGTILTYVKWGDFGLSRYFEGNNSSIRDDATKERNVDNSEIDNRTLIASGSADFARNEYRAISEFKRIMSDIFEGKAIFKTDEETKEKYLTNQISIPFLKYSNDYESPRVELSQLEISINVIKYEQGLVVARGYEGGKWTISHDDYVTYLKSLTTKTTSIRRVTSWGKDQNPTPIIVKKWGKYNFGIFESYFKPAGNTDRVFTTYDVANQQIIEVRASAYFVRPVESSNGAINKYEDEIEEFFGSVEDSLASVASQQ